jgi:hypothetical protein
VAKPFYKRNPWKKSVKPAYHEAAPAVDLMEQRTRAIDNIAQGGYRLFDCPRSCPKFAPVGHKATA